MTKLELMNGVMIDINMFSNVARASRDKIITDCRIDLLNDNKLYPKDLAATIKDNFDGTIKIHVEGEETPVIYDGLEFKSVNFSITEKGKFFTVLFEEKELSGE